MAVSETAQISAVLAQERPTMTGFIRELKSMDIISTDFSSHPTVNIMLHDGRNLGMNRSQSKYLDAP